jgi:PAS domain S-box-containing protein
MAKDVPLDDSEPEPRQEQARPAVASLRLAGPFDLGALVRPWYFYAVPVLSVTAALPLRLLFDAALGARAPALPFAFAIVISAWFGGFLPGMASAILSAVAVWFFVPSPFWTLLDAPATVLLLVVFLAFALIISIGGEAAYRHRALTRRQNAYLEEALDPVFAWTLDGTITFWGGGARRLYGYSVREAIGQRVQDLLQIDLPETLEAVDDIGDAERTWSGEFRHVDRDGRVHIVQSRMRRVQHGNDPPVIVQSTRDITDRREAETRLEIVLSTAKDALASFDRRWNFTYLNESGALRFGASSAELLGQNIWSRFPELVGGTFYRVLHEAAAEQRETRTELYLARTDEWLELHIYPSMDGVTVLSPEITARKRREAENREEGRRKDEFIAVLAHELRGPLAPLCNGIQILQKTAGHQPVIATTTEAMERQTRHLVRLIDDLLDLSRIRRGQIELRRTRICAVEAVRMAVDNIRPSAEAQGQQLRLSTPAEPLTIDADPARMEQIVHNVLTNAVKYSDRGDSIVVTVQRDLSDVVIEISDTGVGIPATALPHLFEMFEQVPEHRDRARGGLGIGLALVRNLVELHGGTIVARSDGTGQGSTFTIRLPLAKTPGVAAASVATHPNATSTPLRILVVDDNADTATSLAMLLELAGHEVESANDGVEALLVAERFRPRLILMDLGMPRLDGYSTARQMRLSPWGDEVKLIALTGWGHAADRQRTHEAGFDAHLVKPVDLVVLEQTIRQLL